MVERAIGATIGAVTSPRDQARDRAIPSDAELRVIRMVAEGATDRAIARRLGVSVVTVRRRVRAFRSRVGANSRIHAVAIAASRGWVKPISGSEPLGEDTNGT